MGSMSSMETGTPTKKPKAINLAEFNIEAVNTARQFWCQMVLALILPPFNLLAFYFSGPNTACELTLKEELASNAEWLQGAGFVPFPYYLHHCGVPQKNRQGYNIRVFFMELTKLPTETQAYNLARQIANTLQGIHNAKYPEKSPIEIRVPSNTSKLFHNAGKTVVMYDLIKTEYILKRLRFKTSNKIESGYYDQFKDYIHCCWAPHTLPLEVARLLHAPSDQVDPALRPMIKKEGISTNESKPPTNIELVVDKQDQDDSDHEEGEQEQGQEEEQKNEADEGMKE